MAVNLHDEIKREAARWHRQYAKAQSMPREDRWPHLVGVALAIIEHLERAEQRDREKYEATITELQEALVYEHANWHGDPSCDVVLDTLREECKVT